ncbi:hypothetical protein, partial [Aeromonas hydrophila]|uniref:hypothetical protein n=1 Tax=Aeromonas hydrophila TaxID=644 RepID=UPI001BFD7B6B
GAKDENTGAGLCRSRLVVQERLGHYKRRHKNTSNGLQITPNCSTFVSRPHPATAQNNGNIFQ